MQASKLYREKFTGNYLTSLFEEKIIRSTAVGRDGIRKGEFIEKLNLEIPLILGKVESGVYKFTGYKQKLISKGPNSFPRLISIPTFRDRLTLRALCDILNEIFSDARTEPPQKYIKEIKGLVARLDNTYCFLRIDIRNYYPSINQEILLKKIRARIRKAQILNLIQGAICTPTEKRNIEDNRNTKGVPQGLSISNILASIYLTKFDKNYQSKMHYFRYVDDILILCRESDSKKLFRKIERDLRAIDLICHPIEGGISGKTNITSLNDGVEYLGYRITDSSTSVRDASYARMFTNLAKVFTGFKYSRNVERLIWRLNLKITGCFFDGKRFGWMFFFSQTEDKAQLARLDKFVHDLLNKHQLMNYAPRVKTFIKAFHEIRYNISRTKYIPNFSMYNQEQKIEIICMLTGQDPVVVATWDVRSIDEKFIKLTGKEVSLLERDLIEDFS